MYEIWTLSNMMIFSCIEQMSDAVVETYNHLISLSSYLCFSMAVEYILNS